jgi:hypothetical protein
MPGDRSRERRRLSAECLALAQQISDVSARALLLEMAQKWLDSAELAERNRCNESLRLRALEAAIGQELHALYELPQELSHRMLTLLMQLNTERGTD